MEEVWEGLEVFGGSWEEGWETLVEDLETLEVGWGDLEKGWETLKEGLYRPRRNGRCPG